MAKAEETAVLTVNGAEFRDWESVEVKHSEYDHPWYHYRFTCSEGMPLAKNWAAMRIIPGMECSVTLAGELAVTGLVCTRQVFVDRNRHHIEIQGASKTMALAGASAITSTGEFKDVSYKQYANALLKPFPAMAFIEQGGSVPTDRFPRISIPPGSSVLEALEMPLRALGGIPLTSDVAGNVVAAVGPAGAGTDTIYEGDLGWPAYLIGREIIYNPGMATGVYGIGQRTGNNEQWGAKVASVPFFGNAFQSLAASYSPQVLPLEVPAWQNRFVQQRTDADRDWQNEDEITVFVTVYGWLKPSGGLWKQSEMVSVVSPMLVMDGTVPLKVKSVTFTQDNQAGTQTTLELCSNAALHGFVPQGPGG